MAVFWVKLSSPQFLCPFIQEKNSLEKWHKTAQNALPVTQLKASKHWRKFKAPVQLRTSCYVIVSEQLHHCCTLANNTEHINCRQTWVCPSIAKKCPLLWGIWAPNLIHGSWAQRFHIPNIWFSHFCGDHQCIQHTHRHTYRQITENYSAASYAMYSLMA